MSGVGGVGSNSLAGHLFFVSPMGRVWMVVAFIRFELPVCIVFEPNMNVADVLNPEE